MTLGPSIFLQCNNCKKAIEITTIGSGNIAGARYWTDGYMFARMLPSELRFRKCPHCKVLFWIDDLKKLGEVDWNQGENEKHKEWGKKKHVNDFDLNDYVFALHNNFARTGEENEYLRIHAWWAFNHVHRWPPMKRFFFFQSKPAHIVEVKDCNNNLIALQEILDVNVQSERLLIAEIARELGRFEECERLLDFEFDESLRNEKDFILKCCKEKNLIVQDMTDYLNEKQKEAEEKYILQKNKYIEEGINFVKTQAITKGLATEDNFYSVIQNLTVKDFIALRGDYKDLHTIHFPKT